MLAMPCTGRAGKASRTATGSAAPAHQAFSYELPIWTGGILAFPNGAQCRGLQPLAQDLQNRVSSSQERLIELIGKLVKVGSVLGGNKRPKSGPMRSTAM